MIRNLLAALFLFALALPAVAMPVPAHGNGPDITENCHDMPMEREDQAPPNDHAMMHGCIGCIAPTLPVLAPMLALQPIAIDTPAIVRALIGIAPKPRDPPPRF